MFSFYSHFSREGGQNVLRCDCSTLWLHEWMTSRPLLSSVLCGKPAQFAGQDVRTLQTASFGYGEDPCMLVHVVTLSAVGVVCTTHRTLHKGIVLTNHTHAHMHMHARTHARTHTHTHAHTHTHTHTHTQTNKQTNIYTQRQQS